MKHDDADENFKETLVHVSAGQSIRWVSKGERFRVAAVRLHAPIEKGAPDYPFTSPLPTTMASEVASSAVRDVEGNVTQRYKISFELEKAGLVDPDVVCSM